MELTKDTEVAVNDKEERENKRDSYSRLKWISEEAIWRSSQVTLSDVIHLAIVSTKIRSDTFEH